MQKIKRYFDEYKIEYNEDLINKFCGFTEYLLECNAKYNLTSITDADEIILKHYIDSIIVLKYFDIPRNAKMIDIGAGAGFPGVPLSIMRPDLRMTFLDSSKKKIGFIRGFVEKIVSQAPVVDDGSQSPLLKGGGGGAADDGGLRCLSAQRQNPQSPAAAAAPPFKRGLEEAAVTYTFLPGRAEEYGRDKKIREAYDFAVSRAVAGLNVLCELAGPFIKPGGYFIAYKSKNAQEEIANSINAFKIIGLKIDDIKEFELKSADIGEENMKRVLIKIKKIRKTPEKYPRNFSEITKKPL